MAKERVGRGESLSLSTRMIIWGALLAALGLLLRETAFSAGVAVGLPFALLFQWWLARTIARTENVPPGKAYSSVLWRALLRMAASICVLALAATRGEAFLLGVLGGLTLPVAAHFTEALGLMIPARMRKGQG